MEDIKNVEVEEEKLQEEIQTSIEDAVKSIEEGKELLSLLGMPFRS